jgi:hypothetical protein
LYRSQALLDRLGQLNAWPASKNAEKRTERNLILREIYKSTTADEHEWIVKIILKEVSKTSASFVQIGGTCLWSSDRITSPRRVAHRRGASVSTVSTVSNCGELAVAALQPGRGRLAV